MTDARTDAARYYDLCPGHPDDLDFYRSRLARPGCRVLEPGCGTGRVLVPLAAAGADVLGVDSSAAMLEVCQRRIADAELATCRARVTPADITRLDLQQEFDLIIAPYRVLQNLASDAEVKGLLEGIERHLAPEGRATLNCFNPMLPKGRLVNEWCTNAETLCWEALTPEGNRVTCHDIRPRLTEAPLVLYPELIYREYSKEELINETVLKVALRCYYPQELVELVEGHGFCVTGRWGGYQGGRYGEVGDLVVEFARA